MCWIPKKMADFHLNWGRPWLSKSTIMVKINKTGCVLVDKFQPFAPCPKVRLHLRALRNGSHQAAMSVARSRTQGTCVAQITCGAQCVWGRPCTPVLTQLHFWCFLEMLVSVKILAPPNWRFKNPHWHVTFQPVTGQLHKLCNGTFKCSSGLCSWIDQENQNVNNKTSQFWCCAALKSHAAQQKCTKIDNLSWQWGHGLVKLATSHQARVTLFKID